MTWVAALLQNKGHVAGYTVLLIMVASAYLAQADKIEELSLEVGELRATVHYQEQAIDLLSSQVDDCPAKADHAT